MRKEAVLRKKDIEINELKMNMLNMILFMIFESIANPVIKRPLLFGYVPLNEENAIM